MLLLPVSLPASFNGFSHVLALHLGTKCDLTLLFNYSEIIQRRGSGGWCFFFLGGGTGMNVVVKTKISHIVELVFN